MTELAGLAVDRLFAGLNEPQREAVAHADGPLLILAGPGSGKTRVITRRAAYLAATVTDAAHVLAITFTNKAAREMRERIQALGVPDEMTVCTFHAFCAKALRRHHDRAGVPRNFTIFDRDDRRKLVKQAVEQCDLSGDRWPPAMVEQAISRAKNDMRTAEDFAETALDWKNQTLARIYARYEQLLVEQAGLDFDDLLMRMAGLVSTDEEIRDRLEDRFHYVLVDEYQDTNMAQYQIARHLTRRRENLCATGDPDQSIYGWRGANLENILAFERDYPGAKVVRLEENYRSTKHILRAADALIAGNARRKEKSLWTRREDGPSVRAVEYEDGEEEARAIAGDMAAQARDGTNLSDMAVFYRVNSLSRALEEALIREGLRYQIARGVEFYNRKEIKDVLSYLRVLVNGADELALLRAIQSPPRGIGATTIQRLTEHARRTDRRLFDVLTDVDQVAGLGRSAARVREFAELLRNLAPALERPPAQALEHLINHSGLRAFYRSEENAEGSPGDNLDELINGATDYQREYPEAAVLDWLEHTALLSDVDGVRDGSGAVTLMTLHAAKGLEFPVVYIIGLEDGLLPLRRRDDDPIDQEEERRLCFVGVTRAKTRLTLSRARYRMLRGMTERTVRSPFLDEMRVESLEYGAAERGVRSKRARAAEDMGRLPEDIEQWSVGTLVRHPLHGLGRILSLHRGAKRTHVDVTFQDGVRRAWVLEFADLQRVDYDEVG